MGKIGAKAPEVTLLSVNANAPGRSFPNWKVAFKNARRLSDVLRCWANAYLGIDVAEEVPGGVKALAADKELSLETKVGSLRETLRVRQGAYSLEILWPAEALPATPTATKRPAAKQHFSASKLRKLHPSARYCYVDRRVMGWGSSSTQRAKVAAGTYATTRGHFPEAELARAMRTPPGVPGEEIELQECVLSALGDNNKVLFNARLQGPVQEVLNWEATCKRCERSMKDRKPDKQALQIPYPVFIPSRGRPAKAHLNWQATHVFGAPEDKPPGFKPVVCLVIEPAEEEEYRATWPSSLMLILPESNCGPGYARWVVQQVCTKFCLEGDPTNPQRFQRIWIVDDTLTMFYRLALMEKFVGCGRLRRPKRMKYRVANEGLMFMEALLAVQKHHFIGRAAVAGFLRDDGTAVCKRNDWKLDELALYKVVMLDLCELWRLGVEYMPQLQMYEDICLNHDVLTRGGHTLKCQCYGFRAVHAKKGGCLKQRDGRHKPGQTRLKDLVQKTAFRSMQKDRQKAVRELLQWVRDKEMLFQKRTTEPRSDAAISGERNVKDTESVKTPSGGDQSDGDSLEVLQVSDSEAETEAEKADVAQTEDTMDTQGTSAKEADSEEDLEMFPNSQSKPLLWSVPAVPRKL